MNINRLAALVTAAALALWISPALAQGDPHFDDVVLLVEFTGSNGQTSATDKSLSGHSLSFNGNAQIQGNKLDLDGAGDYVWAADSEDWLFGGDFTVELFGAEFDTVAETEVLISWYNSETPGHRSWLYQFAEFTDPDRMRLALSQNGDNNTVFDDNFIPATDGTAYNLAFERSGSTVRLYRDGVMVSKTAYNSNFLHNPSELIRLRIGSAGAPDEPASTDFWDGRIAAVRITNGSARYADDGGYSVPSLPLPDFQALPAGEPGTVHIIVN